MSSSSKDKSKTFRIFVENSGGVVEYIVEVAPADDGLEVTSLAGRIASGKAVDLSKTTLQQAIDLEIWSKSHADVFEKGRVVYDS